MNSQQDRALGSSYHHHGAGESVGCFGGSGRSGCPLHQSLRASRVSLWRRQSLWEKLGPAPGTDSRPAGGSSTFVACKITTFRINACPHLRRITQRSRTNSFAVPRKHRRQWLRGPRPVRLRPIDSPHASSKHTSVCKASTEMHLRQKRQVDGPSFLLAPVFSSQFSPLPVFSPDDEMLCPRPRAFFRGDHATTPANASTHSLGVLASLRDKHILTQRRKVAKRTTKATPWQFSFFQREGQASRDQVLCTSGCLNTTPMTRQHCQMTAGWPPFLRKRGRHVVVPEHVR